MTYLRHVILLLLFIIATTLLLQEYSPQLLMPVMEISAIKYYMLSVQDVIKSSLNLLQESDAQLINKSKVKLSTEKLLTIEQLNKYDGKKNSKGLYLAIMGLVFNVKKGADHYGEDGGYSFFAGCDGTRAFVTGDFTEKGLIDEISGLSSQDYIGLDEWIQFYKKDYKYVGKLIGRYYNEFGHPTQYHARALQWINEAYEQKEAENSDKKMFPPCNSEWFPETGSRVYCSKKSGGIDRDWVGVPRKYFTPGKTKPRCACVKNFGLPAYDSAENLDKNRGDLDHPNLKEIPGCDSRASSCHVIEEKDP